MRIYQKGETLKNAKQTEKKENKQANKQTKIMFPYGQKQTRVQDL